MWRVGSAISWRRSEARRVRVESASAVDSRWCAIGPNHGEVNSRSIICSRRVGSESADTLRNRTSKRHSSHRASGAALPRSSCIRRKIGMRRSASFRCKRSRNAGMSGRIRARWRSSTAQWSQPHESRHRPCRWITAEPSAGADLGHVATPYWKLVTMLRCVAMSIPGLTAIPPLVRHVLLFLALAAPSCMKQNTSTAESCSR